MKHFLTTSVAALAMLLTTGLGARADSLPPTSVAWTYNFTTTFPGGTTAVYADGSPSAGVSFTNEPEKSAVGPSDVVVSNLKTFTPLGSGSYKISNGQYTTDLILKVNDNGTIYTGTLNFTGVLNGTFSPDNSLVKNKFTGPLSGQVTLGSYVFTVSDLSYTPPGPTGQSNVAGISAHVEITNKPTGGGGPGTSETPEPGTLILSGLGLTALGGAAWRKRRKVALAA